MDDGELAELKRASDELIVGLRRAWIASCEAVVAHELDACLDRGIPDDEHARLLRERSLAGQRLAQVSVARLDLDGAPGSAQAASALQSLVRTLTVARSRNSAADLTHA